MILRMHHPPRSGEPVRPAVDAWTCPTAAAGSRRVRTSAVRLIVARCSVTYEGRLGARLRRGDPAHRAEGRRLDRGPLRRQGVQAAQLDDPAVLDPGAPTDDRSRRDPEGRDARASSCTRCCTTTRSSSATTPASRRTASRPSSRSCIAARVAALRDDLTLVRREYPTDIGPIDLLCRDGDGRAVVVEVKRVGEIAGVEQLMRYQERLDRDARLAPDARDVRRHAHQAAGTRLRREPRHRVRRDRPRRAARRTTTPSSSCSDPRGVPVPHDRAEIEATMERYLDLRRRIDAGEEQPAGPASPTSSPTTASTSTRPGVGSRASPRCASSSTSRCAGSRTGRSRWSSPRSRATRWW